MLVSIAYGRDIEAVVDTCIQLRRRGMHVFIGDNRGFARTLRGAKSKGIEIFADLLGFLPMEAIVTATKHGGEIIAMGGELGMIKPGCLADILLVDGDSAANDRIPQDKTRLLATIKDGKLHKKSWVSEQRRRLIA